MRASTTDGETLDARFGWGTRIGSVAMAVFGTTFLAFCIAFLAARPSVITIMLAALGLSGAAYGVYRATHLAYRLEAEPQGLRGTPFLGPTVRMAWKDIGEIQRWWAPSSIVRTEHLRLVSRRGRSLTVTSRMFKSAPVSFEDFLAMIDRNAPKARSGRPSRIVRFLIG